MANDLRDFQRTVAHRRPGRILYGAGFTEDLRRRVAEHVGTEDIGGHYGFWAAVGVGLKRPEELPPIDYSPYWREQKLPEGTWINGLGVAEVPSHFYHFTGYLSPLRNATSLRELEEYPLDDLGTWDDSHLEGAVRDAHAAGKPAVTMIGHIYENAWQIRGYEEFLTDLMDRPAWAECLLERLATQNMVKARACARAGVDVLRCGDDVASQQALMFSPDLWRRMFHPPWARIWKAAKEINPDAKIWYHSDGNITPIVGDLIASGCDILNPLQPECLDVDALHRRFGDRLSFDGCIGTQSTMPFGSPADVRARVRECIDRYGREGGLFISPTHVLEPEVPLQNIDALFEACREFGTFE